MEMVFDFLSFGLLLTALETESKARASNKKFIFCLFGTANGEILIFSIAYKL